MRAPREAAPRPWAGLTEIAGLFLKLGLIGFGGPAAHIAMMRDEVVRRRGWLDDQHFLDLIGATSLIPGPNSTEMAIHTGFVRAGWRGLVVAGAAFIFPAMLIVLVLSRAYVSYGSTPQAGALLYGIKPVVIALIVSALWGLGRTALKGRLTLALAGGVLTLYVLGANEILLLVGAGVVGLLAAAGRRSLAGVAPILGGWGLASAVAVPFHPGTLFLSFLKIGAVLYGSGYVLVALLRGEFVTRLGWLTDQQLLDAVAIGQVTPGPVLTTATFVGYLLGGWPAAVLATAGIFLPSFLFVAATNPLIPRLRASPLAAGFLDGVNAGALALMAGVTGQLAREAIVDPVSGLIALVALVLLVRTRLSVLWVVVAGGAAGLTVGALQ